MVDLGADINAKVNMCYYPADTSPPCFVRSVLMKSSRPSVQQEQRNGRSALHLAVDQQNLSLVKLLLKKGADPNLLTSGGHTPYHLTYGRDDDDIRQELYSLTKPDLRELPDSESDDSEEEEDEETDEEVCVCAGKYRASTVGQ